MSEPDDTHEQLRATGIRPLTLGDMVKSVDEALRHVESIGLRWQGTRFQRYIEAIQDARADISGGGLEWAENQPKRALLLEALSQSSQLARSLPLWRTIEAQPLRRRLEDVLSGPDLPIVSQDVTDHEPLTARCAPWSAATMGPASEATGFGVPWTMSSLWC